MPKLSEMSTRKAAGLLGELAVPLGNLSQNPAIQSFFDKYKTAEMNAGLAITGLVQMIPAFLQDNYDDTVAILALLTGKTADEIGDQPITQTIADVRGCVDGELSQLFTSSVKSEPEKQSRR